MSVKTFFGDTIIEVLLATTIFSFVAISSMVIINNNTNNLEANLELTMARTEVDAQAEAIRFIHDAYVAENDFSFSESNSSVLATRSAYHRLWERMTNSNVSAAQGLLSETSTPTALMSCKNYYEGNDSIYAANRHAFAVNTRSLATVVNKTDPNWYTVSNLNKVIVPALSPTDPNNKFGQATTYPRVVYGNAKEEGSQPSSESLISDNSTEVKSVEGIWVIVIPQQDTVASTSRPQFYDFHIYTCWYGPGRQTPTTIGTILRLYNPRYKS